MLKQRNDRKPASMLGARFQAGPGKFVVPGNCSYGVPKMHENYLASGALLRTPLLGEFIPVGYSAPQTSGCPSKTSILLTTPKCMKNAPSSVALWTSPNFQDGSAPIGPTCCFLWRGGAKFEVSPPSTFILRLYLV